MRNTFRYHNFEKISLLNALLNLSDKHETLSILVSNLDNKDNILPTDYVTYDIIAGIGSVNKLISNKDSLDKLKDFHNENKDWLFGYISYDLKNELEELDSNNYEGFISDNLTFFIPEFVILFKNNTLKVKSYNNKEECDSLVSSFNYTEQLLFNEMLNLKARDTIKSYLSKIYQIKEHIKRGDIYEMNYCQEFYSDNAVINPKTIFSELNQNTKSPFASFTKFSDKYILSASPERFLRKSSSIILSQPIKGTMKRGESLNEDEVLKAKLKHSVKDFTENVMITDLVRNDLSVNAISGSVKVEELCQVYTFDRIHQMITTISSRIDDETHFCDVLKATFPMGSMTGAPKINSMKLIDFFEEFKRGVFSGSIGYITPESDFDFNVVIRTILYDKQNKYLSIGVGGAITTNSIPIEEYKECIIKVKPIFNILNFKLDD